MQPDLQPYKAHVPDLKLDIIRTNDFRGKRHAKKQRRWEVIASQDAYLKGTWLDCIAARKMLLEGDFYPDYTRIRIPYLGIEVTVKGKQVFDEDGNEVAV